jgi:hypothetical protein
MCFWGDHGSMTGMSSMMGEKKTYTLEKNGRTHMLMPIEEKKEIEEASTTILLMRGKELLSEVKKEQEIRFDIVRKPKVILTRAYMDDLPEEIHELLEKFVDIVVDEFPRSLPLIKTISHHIDLIPGVSLLNKAVYRLRPQENEEVKRQVQYFMDNGLFREILSP